MLINKRKILRYPIIHLFAFMILMNCNVVAQEIATVIHISSSNTIDNTEVEATINKINSFLNNVGPCDSNYEGAPSTIQLCLARRDFYESPSSGINLLPSTFSEFNSCEDELSLKILPRLFEDPYPTTDYLNIYLVDEICASCENFGCAAGGYSTFPSSYGSTMDGIVLELDTWLGECDDTKIILHEIGHYLGLYHTFEGGCKNDNCMEDGDKVCDTPPQYLEFITNDHICLQGNSTNSCSTDVNLSDPNNSYLTDQDDPDDNIMNYIPITCQRRLTAGQVQRMENILLDVRNSLLNSKGCLEPCTDNIAIDIDPPLKAYIGVPLTIMNNSLGTSVWIVNNEVVNNTNLDYVPSEEGLLQIELYVRNGNESCDIDTSFIIEVVCLDDIVISTSETQIMIGESVNVTIENPMNGISYIWYMQDSIIGTGISISFEMTNQGAQNIYVEGCNANCCQISNILHILVGECYPDNEGDLWIFGLEGVVLDWSSGEPIHQPSVFFGDFVNDFGGGEASTIQLDSNGELLFYSNCNFVWNKNMERMQPLGMRGSRSSTQMVSLRKPGSANEYYIFTPRQKGNSLAQDSLNTVYYSIIDMNANGGLGDIVSKDIQLLEHGPEYINAIRHCNGTDWWVVTHNCGTTEFYSCLLTEDGLDANPVVSSGGNIHAFFSGTQGFIKFSHDGKYLATVSKFNNEIVADSKTGFVDLFEYDNSTGRIGNLVFSDSSYFSPAGIEFSPDNSKLYVSDLRYGQDGGPLVQYDLSTANQMAIMDSKFIYPWQAEHDSRGALQLAKDGKIYMAFSPEITPPYYLDVIHNPNAKGDLSDFRFNDYQLPDDRPFIGLPNFPARVYRQEYPEIEGPDSLNICTDSILTYYSFGRCSFEDYSWELIGKNTLLQTTGDTIQVTFHTKSIDTLLLTRTTACGEYTDRLPITIGDCNFECHLAFDWIEIDTLICEGESPTLHYSSNSEELYVNNILQNKNNTRIDLGSMTQDTCLAFHIVENFECDSSFQVCITVAAPLTYTFDNEVSVCEGNTALIDLVSDADIIELINLDNDSILFLNGGLLYTQPIFGPTSYLLRLARYDGNCDSYFPILVFPDTMVYEEIIDTLFCLGDSLIVNDSLIVSEGSYEFELTTTKGCDSLLILNADYFILPESDTSYLFVCTIEEVDTVYLENVSSDGCIYQDVQIFSLVDLDTTLVQDVSCDAQSLQNDTISLTNLQGCDSIVIIEYEYEFDSTMYYEIVDTTICPENEILVGDSLLTEFGTYIINTTSFDGCDSTISITIDTFELPVQDTVFTVTCLISQIDTSYDEQFTLDGCAYDDVLITIYEALDTSYINNIVCIENSDVFDTIHLFTLDGCDSIVIIENEYVFDSTRYLEVIDTIICPEQNITFKDSLISEEGFYDFMLVAQDGCDSIVALDVSYFELPDIDTMYTITCISSEVDTIEIINSTTEGCTYFDINIITYTPPDTSYSTEFICNDIIEPNDTLTLMGDNGCDSFVIISHVFSLDSSLYFQEIDTFLCPDIILTIGDSTVSNSGYYEFGLMSADGCDSILAVNLEYFSIPNEDTTYNYTCDILEIDTISALKTSENGCGYNEIIITSFINSDTTYLMEIECIDSMRIDTLYLSNKQNCDSVIITEYIFEEFEIDIEIQNPYKSNSVIDLSIENVNPGATYDWYLDDELVCEDCLSYQFTSTVNQLLSVIAINELECITNFEAPIKIDKATKITFANVFSPNGDQINDKFIPIGFLDENATISNFKIFDRWGNMVHFEKTININDESFGWDGNYNGDQCQEGVYVYQLSIIYNNSSSESMIGDVALIR